MRKLAFLFVAFALVSVSFYGCDEKTLTEPAEVTEQSPTTPSLTVEKKPISQDAYVAVYGITETAIPPNGGRGYAHATCPLGTFPFGGYFSIRNFVTEERLPSYENINIINSGVFHDWRGDGAAGYTAGIENNRTDATPVTVWVRAYCFDAGLLKGHQ